MTVSATADSARALYEALDRLAAVWIDLSCGNSDRQQLMRDVQSVMRLVRRAVEPDDPRGQH